MLGKPIYDGQWGLVDGPALKHDGNDGDLVKHVAALLMKLCEMLWNLGQGS